MPEWIVIPNWEKFQHYRDRNPVWIKLYTDLAHRDEWLGLTLAARGLLVTLWAEYALSGGTLGADRVRLMCGDMHRNVRRRTLNSLIDAGFVQLSASKPLAIGYQNAGLEREKEGEPPKPPTVENPKPRKAKRHDELVLAAFDFAENWNGGASDTFDEGLGELERKYRSRLSTLERDKLWDQAFGRKA